tara:strand:+ start:19 stop:747 length:729 start_codon:yes stop_codon:yes gene_type:complete
MTRIEEQTEDQNQAENIVNCAKIINHLNSIRHSLPTAIESPDSRQIFLRGLQKDISSFASWWNIFLHLREKVNHSELPTILCRPEDPLEKTLYEMDSFTKSALQTSTHFHIENLFYSLLVILDSSKSRIRGYENITKTLFEKITLHSSPKEILLELKVLSGIRNSFHNNGIHKNVNFSVTINAISYEFTKDAPVFCASTSDTINLLERYTEILQEILSTPEIASITTDIPDKYGGMIEPAFK